ncbi:MAG TPA: extracellular solute-binding protein [Methylocystis sp.]|nr:extracellular solute-binding protein [Methylocystis sp.]
MLNSGFAFSWSRRRLLTDAAVAAAAIAAPRRLLAAATNVPPLAEGETESYALSLFGEAGEREDFKAFGYVNANAPKGGTLVLQPPSGGGGGSFDSLNNFILRGNPAIGVQAIFDTLLTASLDERDVLYGLVARRVRVSADKRTYTFFLRPEARFHNGSKLTAHDVAFSLNIVKNEGSPVYSQLLKQMESAEAPADDVVVVRLTEQRSRNMPIIVAGMPIFSKAYYTTHKFNETTLEPPLGSSAYKIGALQGGRYIEYVRVADYWAKDLPVNVGQNNFDVIRHEYYSDRTVAFEAFKAGSIYVHEESSAAGWAKGYDFPAVHEGRVKRDVVPDHSISSTQGLFYNVRREAFRDPRIREALGYAFDFEWLNHNLMFDAYKRVTSFFENSDLKAEGPPSEAERALLEPYRDKVPAEVFGEPFRPPVSDGSGQDRNLLRKATQLLLAAGCAQKEGAILLPSGKPFEFEIIEVEPALERVTQPFIKNLKLIGVNARIRFIDSAQYKRRLDDFDFDMMSLRWSISYSPGDDLAAFMGSAAASVKGSQNYIGVADPVVDALIDKASVARTRAELQAAIRALDRVLIAGRYWIPAWYNGAFRIAYWDVFGRPERAPKFDPGISSTWWWDEEKAKKINFRGATK